MTRLLAGFFLAIVLGLTVVPSVQAAACAGSVCQASEVGPFMAGITGVCGNVGTCTLDDIMTVFANVGNWIVGIIGSLVFLFYIYGGIMLLMGGANEENVKKGKRAIRTSTIGLLIVFFAYAAIKTLEYTITGGALGGEAITEQYVTCGPGAVNAGKSCALNSVCTEDGTCVSECFIQHPTASVSPSGTGAITWWDCVDVDNPPEGGAGTSAASVGSCTVGLCPGPTNRQCCEISQIPQ